MPPQRKNRRWSEQWSRMGAVKMRARHLACRVPDVAKTWCRQLRSLDQRSFSLRRNSEAFAWDSARRRLLMKQQPLSSAGQTTNRRKPTTKQGMPIATEVFQIRRNAAVPRITRYSWTVEQLKLLCALVESGASSARASVVLKRPRLAVQNKARQLGRPFADSRKVRALRLAREVSEREAIERSAQRSHPG